MPTCRGSVDGPRPAAPDRLRLHARVDAGLARALSRPRRALDGRGDDRGADQDGLPGLHPREHHRAARSGPTTSSWACPTPSMPARSTCTSRRSGAARQVKRADENTPEFRRAGAPGGGGYGTARAMAAFYQMMVQGGSLNGVRLLSPRTVQYVTRNVTGDRVDGYMGMPMHRGARARTCAAPPSRSAAWARSPRRGPSAMGAWARPIAGPIPTPACPSRTSPMAGCPTRGTAPGST